MDAILAKSLNALTKQNETLFIARRNYLLKEAERKNFEASLVQGVRPGCKSHAEALSRVQATDAWFGFHKSLAVLESKYEFEKLKFEILDKAWVSEYGSFKIDSKTIGRHT